MNDKIKEILDFKEDADYKRLSVDEITALRDYITNLEQCYCNRTDCCGRIKDSKKYSSIYHELKELKSDLLYVLEQLDGYLDKGWTIDLNFTDIREKYKEDIKEYENWK